MFQICWYFTDSWEQYRINGRIHIIDSTNPNPVKLQQRERAWFDSSIRSRLQYLGPSPAAIPSLKDTSFQEPSLDPLAGPVDAFCLLVLDPEQVDFLNLRSNKRITFASRCSSINGEKIWTSTEINP
ncbi:unnamed protein product [Cuscuta epithymum]|uniref:pyridoxal 5'-phosphate synthase n=1 Tax=Cuscuta epithymum TaxID=186058 RepID=A0AAV0GAI5_9ASTE|nr:unnamed protein product [Cuscuta epithymum]